MVKISLIVKISPSNFQFLSELTFVQNALKFYILNNLFNKSFFYFYSIVLCGISFQILKILNSQILDSQILVVDRFLVVK